MIAVQPRFLVTQGRRAMNLREHRRFRAAYDFMVLMAEVGIVDPAIAKFWTEVQTLPTEQRSERFQVQGKARAKRKRRRRSKPAKDRIG
jgi:poly(A) polymerase